MTSEARIEANRRNASRSTGPRTEAGKGRVRLNALKHGLAAETVVLPHEDAAAFEQRRAAWTRELSPGGEVGGYLAERAAKISWQLDRADAAEHAELARRVREIPKERGAVPAATRGGAGPDDPRAGSGGAGRASQAVAGGSAGAAGVLGARLPGAAGGVGDARRPALRNRRRGPRRRVGEQMVRLLGAADLGDAARSADPRLRRVAGIADEARDRLFAAILAAFDSQPSDDRRDRPDPESPDHTAARIALLEVIAEEQQRLMDLLEAHEAEQPDLAAEDAARVSFDTSKEAERRAPVSEPVGPGADADAQGDRRPAPGRRGRAIGRTVEEEVAETTPTPRRPPRRSRRNKANAKAIIQMTERTYGR